MPENDVIQDDVQTAPPSEDVSSYKKKLQDATSYIYMLQSLLKNQQQPVQQQQPIAQPKQEQAQEGNVIEREYPEIAKEIKKRDILLGESFNQMDNVNKELQQLKVDKALFAIKQQHPDVKELMWSDRFKKWVDKHPMQQTFLRILDGDVNQNVDDIIGIFNAYKSETGMSKDMRTPKSGRGNIPTMDSDKPSFTVEQIKNLKPNEFAKLEKQIEEAIIDGRVVY